MTNSYLQHHGVKGMKWGVRKKRDIRSERDTTIGNAVKKFDAVEARAGSIHKQVRAENRAKGQGIFESGRNAFKDPRYKKAQAQVDRADAQLGKTIDKANAKYKSDLQIRKASQPTSKDIRTARKDLRKARVSEIKAQDTLRGKASILLNGEFSPKLSQKYRSMPEREIAYRLTKGEKALHTIMAIGSMGGSLAGTAAAVGAQKAIERDIRRARSGR